MHDGIIGFLPYTVVTNHYATLISKKHEHLFERVFIEKTNFEIIITYVSNIYL